MLYVHICFNSPRALCSGPYFTLSVDKYVSRREDPMLEFIPRRILFNWGLIMNIYIRYIKNRHKPIFEENTVEYHTFLYLKTADMAGFADIWSQIFFPCICRKVSSIPNHPLRANFPETKITRYNLRNKSPAMPAIHTDRFKNTFFNRIVFKYNVAL